MRRSAAGFGLAPSLEPAKPQPAERRSPAEPQRCRPGSYLQLPCQDIWPMQSCHMSTAVVTQTVMAAGPPGAVPAAVQLTVEAHVAAVLAVAAPAEQGPAVLQPQVNSPGHH